MKTELIIFDLDGTLIDSSADIRNAINYALSPYSFDPVSIEETKEMIGEGISRLIDKITARKSAFQKASPIPEEMKNDIFARFLLHYEEHLVDNTPVYPEVRETLEQLPMKKAVISNKKERLSRIILETLGLAPFFSLIVGSETTPERKPSPVPVLYVLDALSIEPGSAVIVGDSTYDIDAGKAAGIRTVAVTYGFRPASTLTHADAVIPSMKDLPDALRRFR